MKIAIIDIETTDFFDRGGLIVEIGICELNLENGEIKKLFDAPIRELEFKNKHRNSWIFKNTTLKFDDILNGKSLKSFRADIQSIFDCYPVTAFNKKFDFEFFRARGFKIENELPCPMILATDVLKIKAKFGGYKYPSVEECRRYYFKNDSYREEHRGYSDAVDEAEIIYKMYKNGDYRIND